MSDFFLFQLGDFVEFQRGYDLPKSKFLNGTVPVVSSNGILGYHNEAKAKGPGITIGRSGTVGLPHFISQDYFPHNTALFVKDFKGNHEKYIYYLLKTLKLQELKSGSGVPTMNRNHLHPLTIFATKNNSLQKLIATVLSALDDKIELNNRINAELEAMAKLIYEYWFVQFDFPFDFDKGKPDSNGKPYKSSGGKIVWNKELKREIPKGWEAKELGLALKTYLGGTPSTKIEEYWNGDVPWLNSGEISDFPIISSEKKISKKAIKNSPTSFLEKGSVLLSITRHLRVSILGIDACFNQSVVGIKENEQFKNSYIYFSVLSDIDRLMSLRTGAQQPHINKEIVDSSPFVVPDQEVLKLFYERVEPIIQRIINNALENQELASLRDWLLPMLMNGQVTVADAEEMVEEKLGMVAEERGMYNAKK